ncbi:MAG: hypothetical protein R2713_10965 [Ilumatobacteraceae bacterium]|nr:hypothetical protein [Acidimicrobiales bacterium]MCB9392837.1 hypothetical protein [Acidimicrobiaceae bacterium]
MSARFATPITFTGPWRSPAQMLDAQEYDGHASVHDEATAATLGLRGAPIEGPTHFSQFDPLAVARWGDAWFERGCISSHFLEMVVAGEQVQATLTTGDEPDLARIDARKPDGTAVLTGTASIGPEHPTTELDRRLASLREPGELFIVDRLHVGMAGPAGETAVVTHDDHNGDLYPFSLAQKLDRITEPHPWYTLEGGASSPWGRAVVPFEMISVLAMKAPSTFPVRGPSIGLFVDLEVRLLAGPVFVGHTYELRRRIVGLGQSRRTESSWIETLVVDPGTDVTVARVLLHSGVFKASYANYPPERLAT